jgi:hypothetical protein
MSKNSFNLSKIKLVNPKNAEKIANDVSKIALSIRNYVYEQYNDISNKELSFEFIKWLCCVLESVDLVQSSTNPAYKIDKKKIIIDLLLDLFPGKRNDNDYNKLVNEFIDFLHNNEMIKSSSVVKQVKNTLINYAVSKCLGV